MCTACIAAIFLEGACSDQRPSQRNDDSSRSVSSSGTDDTAAHKQMPAAAGTPASVQELPFKKGDIPPACRYTGELLGGARWRDANGENVLVVSQRFVQAPEAEPEDDLQRQELYGYHYILRDSGTALLWKIQDAAENMCDRGAGLVSDVIVRDLNGDGIAENAFVYNVQGSCDVSPIPFKLMLHSDSTKYAVRGDTRVDIGEGRKIGGVKTFDPAFDGAPPGFRAFADSMWRAVLKASR